MGTDKDSLLVVNHLSVDYYADNGTVHAVDDVSFVLRRGEIMGLAGESGSGKSTLAYAIARLLRPPAAITNGEALYFPSSKKDEGARSAASTYLPARGKRAHNERHAESGPIDILQLSPAQLRAFRWDELSIVFQSAMNALNPVMDIGTQIMDALKAHRPDMGTDARRKRAVELLNLVGIASDRLRSYPHELSGGMRQRAVIAIALALRPELIIMDEPTTALDVVVQREILELISALCKEFNTALIFITHDLSLLLELADHIAIMYAGRLVETTPSRDLYLHPRHPYSYGLLHSFPTLHGPLQKMAGIPGSPPDLRSVPPGCPFHPRCPLAFDPCNTVVPLLRPFPAEQQEQRVACHLYDPRFREEPPDTSILAEKYKALAEGSKVQ
ncbi:MAG TPA: ABC transporter ATP-binding protein [Ktedonobacteraceae bacterium]|nr:ABC transporter ATP-binding protein [Ktedonobacteraceae bacterium]